MLATLSDVRASAVARWREALVGASLIGVMSWAVAAPGTAALPSDPAPTEWMQGAPPSADRMVTLANGGFGYPRSRWSFSNMRRLLPTANVWRGEGPVAPLLPADGIQFSVSEIPFTDMRGGTHKFSELMSLTDADGIIVLHRGRVVYERYAGVLRPHTPHAAMSVTKSLLGTLAEMLVEEGRLDPVAPVTHYVPELAGTAFDGANVRQLLDMTVAVKYSEKYADPSAQIWSYFRAVGVAPRPVGYVGPANLYDFLKALKRDGEHGAEFSYKTVDAEALGWVLKRATGESLADLVSEMIWRPMGAEQDGYFDIDSQGTECAGGGFNATLRDLARFGEVMRNNGRYNGHQIVPADAVSRIRRGGNRARFAKAGYETLPGWSYTSMWWVSHDDHGAFEARGIFGQAIYVDPRAEMTIVRLASGPRAANEANDWVTLPAFRAVGEVMISGAKSSMTR
ncbi:serine hydrolase domain-containing protein [Pandoraea bronchicola]|uniref:6-aminohexanoate hydrolase n=1 Tax=Pandoraea bronchicola TaxID=2508287 RepID=A0A5E5BYG6_9BURK|nr:serine hydrolase [Pandoraea bronchicola]VVE90518.1 6-aminohexanoate hydrolase [Pandoraea bronchicola]